jgi:Mn2+/Fe2+ NRAMP family transporter
VIFSLGLWAAAFTTFVTVAMTMTYFMLDLVGRNWRYTPDNKAYRVVLAAWIIVPAILTPFWNLPSLIQSIIAMAGNLFLTPLVILIIMIFVNKKSLMGKYKANIGRNIVLACTLLFSLYVVVYGVNNFVNMYLK